MPTNGATAGYRTEHEMLRHRRVHQEYALGPRSYGHGVPNLHAPHAGSELSVPHQLHENLQQWLVGSGSDGICPFDSFQSEGAVLPRLEVELETLRLHLDDHEVVGVIDPFHQFRTRQIYRAVAGGCNGLQTRHYLFTFERPLQMRVAIQIHPARQLKFIGPLICYRKNVA